MAKLQFASLYQDLFQKSSDLIYFANSDGEIEIANNTLLNKLGYTLPEVVGNPILNFISPSERILYKKIVQDRINDGIDYTLELSLIKKDGSLLLVEGYTGSIILNDDDVYNRGVFRDITVQKKSDKEKEDLITRLNLFLQNAPEAVIIIDENQKIKEWNLKAEAIFGHTKEEVKHRSLNEIMIPHRYRDAHNKGMAYFLKTGDGPVLNKTIEVIAIHKTGYEFSISLSISNVKIEDEWLFIAFISDITEQKAIKEKTEKQENELKQSQLLNEKKNDFLSVASHELKTPLTTIKAFSQLALMVGKNKADPTILSYLEKINTQTSKLTHLVNELLDVSRIQSGKMILSKTLVDFEPYFQETINNIQLTIPTHKIVILESVPLKIEIDSLHLEQVITNLITNAAKYSPGKEIIEVTSTIQNNSLLISVKDYGVGISSKDQGSLFGKFYRVEEIINDFSGHGIGLYISLEIIKQHKGEIWVESEQNTGSTFSFSLPLTK
ncbi:MAG: sensor histidine kinase [Sphingobacteriales bacterium]|nr:sensor histidine kinase [Sphingobacteriales bacterium]